MVGVACFSCGRENDSEIDYCSKCMEQDFTGCPTWQVAAIYKKYRDKDISIIAERCEMDVRDLRKYVITQNWSFTGLKVADKIFVALGLSLNTLVENGEVVIVPKVAAMKTALRMVEDEIWAANEFGDGLVMTDEEKRARAVELVALREKLCEKTPEQAERSKREWERSAARAAERERAIGPEELYASMD